MADIFLCCFLWNDTEHICIWHSDEKGKIIISNYEKDTVPEEKYLESLKNSNKDERIQSLLYEILFDVKTDSISDKIFEYCLNYPTPWKETLLEILAHMHLKKEQLEQLNQIAYTSEAFYQLFFLNLYDNNLNITQFRDFLLGNKKYFGILGNFQKHNQLDYRLREQWKFGSSGRYENW